MQKYEALMCVGDTFWLFELPEISTFVVRTMKDDVAGVDADQMQKWGSSSMWYRFWSFQSSDGNDDKPADGVPVFAGTTDSPRCAAATWEIWIEVIEIAAT